MKFLYLTTAMTILLALSFIFFPAWWWIVFIPFALCLAFTSNFKMSLGASSLSAFLVWGCTVLYKFFNGGDLITHRMRDLFGLDHTLYFLIVVIVFGILAASLSGMTGTALRTFFVDKKKQNYYY